MKTRILLVAAAMLIFASLSFGQGFIATFYSADLNGNPVPVTYTCGGQDGMADGTMIQIFWDANANGPDAADVQPTVGDLAGQVNFNAFPINSGLGVAGTFATDPSFVSVGILPANPRYYLHVYCPNGDVQYTSAVYTLASGPQDVMVYEWTCAPCGTPPCTPTTAVQFYNEPIPQSVCINLCANSSTAITVCPTPGQPALDPARPPIVTIVSGCLPPNCNVQCTPGEFIWNPDPLGWTYDAQTGCFVNVVHGVTDNTCACVTLEGFLAAGVESFSGMPGDNSVVLTWASASEAGVASYAVVRNGDVIANVAATNPNGATYTYTDETAVNGTTYTYGLRVVHNDNTSEDAGFTVTATPSFSHAIVTEYALHQNFPNPFNPTTSITFDVVEKNFVSLKVFNAAGQVVATVVNGEQDAGRHIVTFDAANLTSGLYFYTVKIGNEFSATKKMLLVK